MLHIIFVIWIFESRHQIVNAVECDIGYFNCNETDEIDTKTVCIPQINICDDIADCADGSDEFNCDDTHSNNYFDNMFKKRPGAEHDDFENFCVLQYNGTCHCRLRDIFCRYKGLNAAPGDFHPDDFIDIFDLTGNKFVNLSARIFEKVPDIVDTLVLQQCESRWIERGTFRSFTTLRKLHIDNNFIKILPDDVFAVNNSLEILTLRYNEISELHPQVFQQLGKLLELDLSNNELSSIDAATLQTLSRLTYLNLRGNKISLLGENNIPQFPFLSTLNLENNLLEYIVPGTFALTPQLQNLYLSRNKLRYLTNGTFDGLSRLLALTLVGNQIGGMDSNVFIDTGNLTSLDFRGNRFNKFDKKVLRSLQNLKHIYFDSFEMCIFAPHVRVCEPKSDGISSQEHLLDNLVLRTSVWIMASVGCVGNVMVLLGRFIGGPTNNVVHSLYIKNLALSDLLMGIYLFAIASVDYRYRGEYLQHQWRWRHSTLCNICGFLNTLSCESSVLILSLVTWDRFVSVTQPLARKQPSPRAASFTLIFLWTLAAIVATIPLTSVGEEYFGNDFYGSNGVCLPLYIHNPFAKGWLYSILLFICVNALALLFICYAYSRMIREIHKSTKACRSTQQSQDRDKVAQRFGIIVLTDCLCWVPVIIIKVAALSGMQPSETYHRFVYATLAIYVMPINSALNPILYTLTTTLFKKQIKRFFDSCLRSRRPCHSDGLHNSGCDSGYSHSLSLFPKRESARRILTYRGTQTSLTTTKNSSCKRPTAV